MVTVMIEGVWLFLIFNLSCNVSSISNQSFAEQTTNTYNINTCDKVSFKTCKAKLKQLRQALLRTPFNNHYCEPSYYFFIIFNMLPKILK